MPPKAQKKKQQKIIQDRTFGLKNKNKSKAVQKFCKGVEQTVKYNGKSATMLEAQQFQKKKLKKKQEEEAALLNALYSQAGNLRKNADDDEDDDPKNTVCPYFKQGLCQKGKKCIYSHDLTLDRTDEIDLYTDQRTQLIMNQIGGKQLNMMTQQQLNKIINQKEKQFHKGNKSDIVCKHFLDAVQKSKYGWNWNCVNGDKCQYKHCLPPGYKLKKDIARQSKQQIDVVAKIDQQRNKLLNQNKSSPFVTYQIFLKWKEDKKQRLLKQAEVKKKQQEKKKGNKNMRTGKQLFTYDPTLFIDDQEAAVDYNQREEFIQQEEEGLQKRQQIHEEEEGEEEEGEEEQLIKEEKPHQEEQETNQHQN